MVYVEVFACITSSQYQTNFPFQSGVVLNSLSFLYLLLYSLFSAHRTCVSYTRGEDLSRHDVGDLETAGYAHLAEQGTRCRCKGIIYRCT